MSLPVRGAWIEMLKSAGTAQYLDRRSPCGERGLKCQNYRFSKNQALSLPVRGAWIEIALTNVKPYLPSVAPRAGSVD